MKKNISSALVGLLVSVGVLSNVFAADDLATGLSKDKAAAAVVGPSKDKAVVQPRKNQSAGSDVKDVIKKTFESRFPMAHVTTVLPTPFPNMYEVIIGRDVAFTDKDVKSVVFGHLFDAVSKTDLSQADVIKFNKVDVSKFDLKKAIKTVRGNGSRVFYEFSDPDCPFCKSLEENIKDLTDVTIYTFLFPIDQLHPHASDHAKQIWCSKDPAAAWREYMLNKKMIDENPGTCDNPVADTTALGASVGVTGTPTIIFPDGRVSEGAVPKDSLEKLLSEVKK